MIKKSNYYGWILGTIIAYWAVSASFFSLNIPVVFSLFVVLAFIGILAINSKRYIINGKLFLACVAILIPYLRYSRLPYPGDWYSTLIYPAIVMFVYYSYKFNGWEKSMFRIMVAAYLVYALFTIAMLFGTTAINIACRLFPSSADLMMYRFRTARFCGLTNHYSTNGMLLAVGTLIVGCRMIQERRKWNVVLFAIFMVALLLTGKRAQPIFSVFVLVLTYYFFSANKKKSRLINLAAIGISILAISYIIIQYIPALATLFDRFEALEESGDISNGRYALWRLAFENFAKAPIFGVGWEQFSQIQAKGWDTHNVYIQLLCETGIVGFACYAAWFLYFLVKAIGLLVQERTYKYELDGENEFYLMFSLAFQAFFLIYSLTGNPLYVKIMYVPYFVSCALVVKVNRIAAGQAGCTGGKRDRR